VQRMRGQRVVTATSGSNSSSHSTCSCDQTAVVTKTRKRKKPRRRSGSATQPNETWSAPSSTVLRFCHRGVPQAGLHALDDEGRLVGIQARQSGAKGIEGNSRRSRPPRCPFASRQPNCRPVDRWPADARGIQDVRVGFTMAAKSMMEKVDGFWCSFTRWPPSTPYQF